MKYKVRIEEQVKRSAYYDISIDTEEVKDFINPEIFKILPEDKTLFESLLGQRLGELFLEHPEVLYSLLLSGIVKRDKGIRRKYLITSSAVEAI